MSDQLTIWQISDGKPGHENQSLGLIDAIGRIRPCESFRIDVSEAGNFWTRWRAALAQAKPLPMAQLIIGAGHATHFPLWCLRRVSGAKAVVLMKPSLPMSFFDLRLAPRHVFTWLRLGALQLQRREYHAALGSLERARSRSRRAGRVPR